MKTTKQDSKMKQENEATVSDKTARQLEHKESPQQVSTSGAEVMPVDTEQLAFELLVAESLATVAKDKPESKKRKDKDDKDEDVKAKKEAIDANDQSSSGEQVKTGPRSLARSWFYGPFSPQFVLKVNTALEDG